MSAHPTQATHPDDPGQPAAGTHRHSQALDDLIAMGASLARALHRQSLIQAEAAQAAVPPHPAAHAPHEPPSTALVNLATAFDRIARAVRRCVALAQRLDQPPKLTLDPAAPRTNARKQVIRAVEDTIHRAAHEGDRAEALTAELRDRLDDPDLDTDLLTRPIADIIAEIRRDLGLASPPGDNAWRRRTPADIHDLNARAAAPSRPRQPSPAQHTNQATGQPSPPGPPAATSPLTATPPPANPANLTAAPSARPSAADRTTTPGDPAEAVAPIFRHPGQWRPPLPVPEPV